MGTDFQGRDVLSRVVWGARVSMQVALVGMLIYVVVAVGIGVTSAYYGGIYDLLVQRLVDAVLVVPLLILALVLMVTLGVRLVGVAVVVGGVYGVRDSRVVRASAMAVKGSQYVESARAVGARATRVMGVYILPNIIGPLTVLVTLVWGNIVLVESSLSFLGFGVPPPLPSWGRMLSDETRRYAEAAPWMAVFPGLAVSLTVFAFNMLGDALRDLLDPRIRYIKAE